MTLPWDQPPDEELVDYVPNYRLIHQCLRLAADTVLAVTHAPVTAETLLCSRDIGFITGGEAEQLLTVLQEAGLVGPADQHGRRTVVTGKKPVKKAMGNVKVLARTAGNLGSEAVESW